MTTAERPRSRFGELLREYRLAAGLSQEALAELATMSVHGVSALERGTNRAPQRETLALLVDALKLDADRRRAIEAAAVRPSLPRKAPHSGSKRHNLPRSTAHLYGRENEISVLKPLMRETALVTLCGAGGVGKTRLAQEVGEQLIDDFDDGVWFVDLARISDPALVTGAAASPFAISESAEQPLIENLTHYLHRKRALLIIDNCEHVVAAAAQLVQTLVGRCANVHILATSRQSLNVPGEQLFRVASLEPEPAIALFTDRAKRASLSFELSDENRETIARIVRRLDGIALAIELAAARLSLLSPEQLEERLSECFRVLSGGSPTSLPRQQTMRATIDWSYDLLDGAEQTLFRRLAVFSGGFSLEAAAAVCADAEIDDWRIFELLASIVDKSLVNSERLGNIQRYRLLESMRAYAREKADSTDGWVQKRHAEYFATVAEQGRTKFPAARSTLEWAHSFDPDLENFRAALDWAFGPGNDPQLGTRILASLQELWILLGVTVEALRYAQRALAAVDTLPLQLRAALWLTLARMQHEFHMNPREMLDAARHACELYEELGECPDLAMAFRERGNARLRLGDFASARKDLKLSLEIYRKLGDARMVARTLGSIGYLLQIQGEFSEARSIGLEVTQMLTEIGDDRSATVMSMNVAETEFALGEAESAVARAQHNLSRSDVLRQNTELRAGQEANLAAYLIALGRIEDARSIALAAMRDADYKYAAVPMQHLASTLAGSDPKSAAKLLGYVEKVLTESGFSRERTEMFTYDRLMSGLRANLSDGEIDRLQSEGAAMSEEQALKLARRRPH